MWHFIIVITWQVRNVISRLSQDLCTPNLAVCWLRISKPHPQRRVKHWSRGHVTDQKLYIFTFPRSMALKTDLVLGRAAQKLTWHFDSVVIWQFRNVIFSQPQELWSSNWAGYWLFCGYYSRRNAWSRYQLISILLCQKKYIPNVEEPVEM